MPMQQTAVKYDLEVREGGRIELDVPFPAGTPVAVFVVEQRPDEFTSLLDAAQSSLDFWDNPWDDEDWIDRLTSSISDEATFQKAQKSGREFRQADRPAERGDKRQWKEHLP